MLRMWEKLVMLSVLAATTCLFRGNVKEIMSAPGGREAAERALRSTIAIAEAEGYTPTPEARPYITVTASAPDSVTVQYQWQQAKDQPGMPTGIGSVRFTVAGGALKALDPIPGPK